MRDELDTEMCPRDDIAAYLDGELSADGSAELDRHIDSCAVCRRTLFEQRQMLAAISASLEDSNDLVLPEDFTKKIVLNAESSVFGLRTRNERRTAVLISLILILFGVFAFRSETTVLLMLAVGLGEKVMAVCGFLFRIVGNLAFAIGVVGRSIASHEVVSGALLPLAIIVVGIAIYFSSRWMLRRRAALIQKI